MAPASLFSRPLDLIFFGYFVSHIPISLLVDLRSLHLIEFIPPSLDVHAWYIATYHDPFMTPNNLYWFKSFIWCEFLLQLPFFFYAAFGLYNGMWKGFRIVTIGFNLPIYYLRLDSPSTRLPLIGRYLLMPPDATLTSPFVPNRSSFFPQSPAPIYQPLSFPFLRSWSSTLVARSPLLLPIDRFLRPSTRLIFLFHCSSLWIRTGV